MIVKSRILKYFSNTISITVGAISHHRQSVDSAAMADFRPSDIQLNLLNNTNPTPTTTTVASTVASEVVMLPSNLAYSGSSLHHPHHRHHRPFPLQSSSKNQSSASSVLPPSSPASASAASVASAGTPPTSSQTLFTDIP